MALPKRRHSKTRRDKSRTHQKLALPAMGKCPQCNQPKLMHRVCPNCGYYHKREIITVKEETKE